MSASYIMRTWPMLYSAHDPRQAGESWMLDGVFWSRARHVHWSTSHSFRLEFHTLVRQDSEGWHLIVVKELFWGQDREKPLRDTAWCKVLRGRMSDIVAWIDANLPAGLAPRHDS